MAELKARFTMIDDISEKLMNIASIGQQCSDKFTGIQNAAESAMASVSAGTSNAINSLNNITNSASNMLSASSAVASSANDISNSVSSITESSDSLSNTFSETAGQIGNYTESLDSAAKYTVTAKEAIDNSLGTMVELAQVFPNASRAMDEYIDSGKLSAETMDDLNSKCKAAENAMENLNQAHFDLRDAADKYNAVMESGTASAAAKEAATNNLKEALERVSITEAAAKNTADEFKNALDEAAQKSSVCADSMETTVSAVNETSTAMNSAKQAAAEWAVTDGKVAESLSNLGMAAAHGAIESEHWKGNISAIDKSMLASTNTIEQLVQKNKMYVDALFYEGSALSKADAEYTKLDDSMSRCANVHGELSGAIEQSNSLMSQFAENGNISAKALEQYENAGKSAEHALTGLEAAQKQAEDAYRNLGNAMEEYMAGVKAGTPDITLLEKAQIQAADASKNLADAEETAKKAIDDVSKASEAMKKNADEMGDGLDNGAKKGIEAFEALAETIVAKKIAETVRDIAKSAYELADAFSEAEKVVVNATGATGDALKGLESSMMSAYKSNSQDLDTVAGAIGEINTRMGLTGAKLDEVTDKFLDYSRITGTDVVGSVQNVTKAMNQWGVDMDDVESVLDRLAYAGQISGASVDTLTGSLVSGASMFREVGLSLDNTIQLLADFELAGINSSTAMMAMRTAAVKFAKSGDDAKNALIETIIEIQRMEDSSEATAKAVEIFGNRAGLQLASAIRNGTLSVESFNADLSAAQGTLMKTAAASETLGEKWDKSSNKLKSAFTSVLQPSIDSISGGLSDAQNGIGEFLDRMPVLTGIITALGVGLGAAALSIAAIGAAALTTIPAVAAFGTTIKMALGPIGWIAAGASLLTGGIMLLSNVFSSSEDDVADYNGTLRQCSDEITRTEEEYRNVCAAYGESSSAAEELSQKLDTLHAQYRKGGGVTQDYTQRLQESRQAMADVLSDYNSRLAETNDIQNGGMIAAAQLDALSKKTQITNTDLDMMSKYADYLNNTFNCDIKVNYDTGELTGFDPTDIISVMEKAVKKKQSEAAMESVTSPEFTMAYSKEYENLKALEERVKNAEEEMKKLSSDPSYSNQTGTKWFDEYMAAMDDFETQKAIVEGHNDKIRGAFKFMEQPEGADDWINVLENMDSGYEKLDDTAASVSTDISEANEKVKSTIEANADSLLELCDAYDKVYESALDSFQKQFGLFEKAPDVVTDYEHTVKNVQDALDSQMDYWETYQANLEKMQSVTAEELGVSKRDYDAFMDYVLSGAPEVAGLLDSMTYNIKNGNIEAVGKMMETQGKVTEIQEKLSHNVDEWKTGLGQAMDETLNDMETSIKALNLSDEAQKSANSMMSSYISEIRSAKSVAVTNAKSVVDAVKSVFEDNNFSFNYKVTTSSGKDFEPDAKKAGGGIAPGGLTLVGEQGPELIWLNGGEMVYNNGETNRILAAVDSIRSAGTPAENNVPAMPDTSPVQPTPKVISVDMSVLDGVFSKRLESLIPTENTVINVDLSVLDGIVTAFRNIELPEEQDAVYYPKNEEKIIAPDDGTFDTTNTNINETRSFTENKSEHKIVIEVTGKDGFGSSREITGFDAKQAVRITQEELEPVMIGLFSRLMFEEGDRSHEF